MPSIYTSLNDLPGVLRRYKQSRFARNFGWMLLGQGLGFIFQAAYFILLARLLGSLQYGIFVGAFAFTSLLSQYSSFGMGTVFLRYVSGNQKEFAPYWGNILMATITTSGVLAVGLTLLGKRILNPDSAHLVFLAAIANCLCAQLIVECARVFQSFEEMRVTALLNLLTNAARTLTVAAMVFTMHHATAWQWTIASVIVSALASIAAVVSVLVFFGAPRFHPRLLFSHAWEGFGFSFASSTSSIYNDVDKTMLSHYGMNHANGVYTTAYRVIDIATMPVFALRDAAIPKLFQAGHESLDTAARLANRLLKRSLAVSIALFTILQLIAPILPKIVGSGFAESVSAIRWLALIPAFRSIHQMTGSALMASGFQRYRTAGQLLAAVFNLALNIWLIPRHGWLGAAWASLATDSLLALSNYILLTILRSKLPPATTPVQAA